MSKLITPENISYVLGEQATAKTFVAIAFAKSEKQQAAQFKI